MRQVVIESGVGAERLEITVVGDGRYDNRWIVRLETPSVSAIHEFWSGIEPVLLVRYFESLAEDWRGWDDAREWKSIEHDFQLAATHDGRGHILLWVTLGAVVAADAKQWLVRAPLSFEAGALDRLAAIVRALA